MPDFCHAWSTYRTTSLVSHKKKNRSPNWIHVLHVTSGFKNEHPHITVSQKAYGNRKPRHLWCLQRTPVSLSPRGGNCVASLFVRFYTSLLMSTQIKMTVQTEGSRAQSSLTHSISWEKKMQWEQKRCACCQSVCAWGKHANVSTCRESEVGFFLEWKRGQPWGLNFHSSSDWLPNYAFPPS